MVVARAFGQVAVQKPVRFALVPALPEIHQQEGQVVKDIGRRNDVVELDGVEQNRFVVDEDDIAQVRVAVAKADMPGAPSGLQQGPDFARMVDFRRFRQRAGPPGRIKILMFGETPRSSAGRTGKDRQSRRRPRAGARGRAPRRIRARARRQDRRKAGRSR